MKPRRGRPTRQRSFVGGWAIAAVLAVVAILLYQIRIALLPFVFAVAVAFVSDPLIRGLQQRLGSPRWPIAAALYVLLLAMLGGAGYWIGTTAVPDLMHVVAQAPEILRHLLGELIGSEGVTLFGQTYTPDKLVNALTGAMAGMIGLTAVERIGGLAVSLIFGAVLTLVLMPYFMISAPRLSAGAIWLLPPERRRSSRICCLELFRYCGATSSAFALSSYTQPWWRGSASARSSICPMPFCWRLLSAFSSSFPSSVRSLLRH